MPRPCCAGSPARWLAIMAVTTVLGSYFMDQSVR